MQLQIHQINYKFYIRLAFVFSTFVVGLVSVCPVLFYLFSAHVHVLYLKIFICHSSDVCICIHVEKNPRFLKWTTFNSVSSFLDSVSVSKPYLSRFQYHLIVRASTLHFTLYPLQSPARYWLSKPGIIEYVTQWY